MLVSAYPEALPGLVVYENDVFVARMIGTWMSTMNSVLKPEHKVASYCIREDEDFLYLNKDNKIFAVWNANKASADTILAEADNQDVKELCSYLKLKVLSAN